MFVVLLIYAIQYKVPFYYPLFNKRYLNLLNIDSKFIHLIQKDLPFYLRLKIGIDLFLIKYILPKKNKLLKSYPYLDSTYSDKLIGRNMLKSIFEDKSNVVTNYLLSDIESCLKYRNTVIDAINWDCRIQNKIKAAFAQHRQSNLAIIGLHIRHTDFKQFEGGKYFFEIADYFKILKKCILMLDGKCVIYICSDSNLDVELFDKSIGNVYYSKRNYVEDFLILKHSDYIVSTRSVFSMMANFFGNNKIFQFLESNLNHEDIEFLDCESLLYQYYDFSAKNNRL
jgi:hypothetical protein